MRPWLVLALVSLPAFADEPVPAAKAPNGLWWDAGTRTLYIADEDPGQIVAWRPAKACAHLDPVAKVAAPDLLAPGPGGSVLAASRSGGVTLVCPDGKTREVAPAHGATRGIAYDPAGRIFVVERGGDRPALRSIAVTLGGNPCH